VHFCSGLSTLLRVSYIIFNCQVFCVLNAGLRVPYWRASSVCISGAASSTARSSAFKTVCIQPFTNLRNKLQNALREAISFTKLNFSYKPKLLKNTYVIRGVCNGI
jgi:hypothetical protein